MAADYPAARVLLEEGLAISRELGHWYVGDALYHLGTAAYFQDDYPGARAWLEESLTIRRALGHRQGIAGSLAALGIIAHDQGDYPTAEALLKEDVTINWELGDRRAISESLENVVARTEAFIHLVDRRPQSTTRLMVHGHLAFAAPTDAKVFLSVSTSYKSHSMGSIDISQISRRCQKLVPGSVSCRTHSPSRRSIQYNCPASDSRTS